MNGHYFKGPPLPDTSAIQKPFQAIRNRKAVIDSKYNLQASVKYPGLLIKEDSTF